VEKDEVSSKSNVIRAKVIKVGDAVMQRLFGARALDPPIGLV
jgi:hypothetical protein